MHEKLYFDMYCLHCLSLYIYSVHVQTQILCIDACEYLSGITTIFLRVYFFSYKKLKNQNVSDNMCLRPIGLGDWRQPSHQATMDKLTFHYLNKTLSKLFM